MNSTRSQHMKACFLLLAVYACVGLGEGSRHKMFSQPVARAMSLSQEHFGNDTAAMLADVHEELLMDALLAEAAYIPDAAASTAVVAQHNTLRARHGAGPLVWDDPLARLASKYARKCIFAADPDSKAGENIFLTSMTGASNTTFLIDAVNMWYADGAAKYNYANPGFSPETGTFTQVTWGDARLGKGTASSSCHPRQLVLSRNSAASVADSAAQDVVDASAAEIASQCLSGQQQAGCVIALEETLQCSSLKPSACAFALHESHIRSAGF